MNPLESPIPTWDSKCRCCGDVNRDCECGDNPDFINCHECGAPILIPETIKVPEDHEWYSGDYCTDVCAACAKEGGIEPPK